MDAFARIVIGFHGCTEEFARELLLGDRPISAWQPSTNDWDWLGHGIYLWEHAPERALRWAQEKHGPRGQELAVLGAVLLQTRHELEEITDLGHLKEKSRLAIKVEEFRCQDPSCEHEFERIFRESV